jgi:hypothetical protein
MHFRHCRATGIPSLRQPNETAGSEDGHHGRDGV